MAKFGLYTRNATESVAHINTVNVPTADQAEAYFAGVKRLSLEQFRNLFTVREIKSNNKNLLLG